MPIPLLIAYAVLPLAAVLVLIALVRRAARTPQGKGGAEVREGERCWMCHGMGRAPCPRCGGSGARIGAPSAGNPSGRTPCGCGGGYMTCMTCQGTGRRRAKPAAAGR